MGQLRSDIISTNYTDIANLGANNSRTYFAVFLPNGGTICFGGGTGKVEIVSGWLEPMTVPTSSILVEATGDFTICESAGYK